MPRTSRSPADLALLTRWARVTGRRRAHVARVAALPDDWADAMEIADRERGRWLRAALMHDALKDAPVRLVRELADGAWPQFLHPYPLSDKYYLGELLRGSGGTRRRAARGARVSSGARGAS